MAAGDGGWVAALVRLLRRRRARRGSPGGLRLPGLAAADGWADFARPEAHGVHPN